MTHRRGLSMQFQLDLLRESLGEFGLLAWSRGNNDGATP